MEKNSPTTTVDQPQQIGHPIFRTRRKVSQAGLRLRVSERKPFLFLVDVFLINSALLVALLICTDSITSFKDILSTSKWFFTLTFIWCLSAVFFDCYDLALAASTRHSLRNSSPAVLVTLLIYTFTPILTPPLQSRGLLFIFSSLAISGIILWRLTYAKLFVQPQFVQRSIVVGAGKPARELAEALESGLNDGNPFHGTGYQILSFVDDDPKYTGTKIKNIAVIAGLNNLTSLVQALEIDEIILAKDFYQPSETYIFDELLHCRELGLRLTSMPILYERLLGRIPVEHIGQQDLYMILPMKEVATARLYKIIKRVIEIGIASLGILIMCLLIPFIALINALTSPGPLFYRQTRVGLGGCTFEMFKFRSMIPGAEQVTGAVWANATDNRITSIGRFLRRTRIDEIPQFLTII